MSDAFAEAAARQLARDELWRRRPPLAADCDHDLLCLLCIEPRQTVICRNCGGLDEDAAYRVLTETGTFTVSEAGGPVRLLESGLRVTYETFPYEPGVDAAITVSYDRWQPGRP
jgi:hypothetical protein